jgi:hypothetical protein
MRRSDVASLLEGVVNRLPAQALQTRNPSEIRKRQALFHQDRTNDVLLSQLANAAAEVLLGKTSCFPDALVALAQTRLEEWRDEGVRLHLQEWSDRRREDRAKAVAAFLPTVRVILEGLERVRAREASTAAEVKRLLRKKLFITGAHWQLTRVEAGRLLTECGVKRCTKAGRAVLSLHGKCLRIPVDRCICGHPPPEDVFAAFEHTSPADASTLSEVHTFVRRVRDVSHADALRLTREAGIVAKRHQRRRVDAPTCAAFRDGHYLRIPPDACVLCGRSKENLSEEKATCSGTSPSEATQTSSDSDAPTTPPPTANASAPTTPST